MKAKNTTSTTLGFTVSGINTHVVSVSTDKFHECAILINNAEELPTQPNGWDWDAFLEIPKEFTRTRPRITRMRVENLIFNRRYSGLSEEQVKVFLYQYFVSFLGCDKFFLHLWPSGRRLT